MQQFCQFRIWSVVFFVPSMLRAPFFTKYHLIFWKYAPRPRWEAWFWKRHKSKIMKNVPLRPSNFACMHLFCTTDCNLKVANPLGNAYCLFIAPFRKLCLASCALSHGSKVTFPLFASHLASFCAKMLASLGTSKAKAHATHVSVAQHMGRDHQSTTPTFPAPKIYRPSPECRDPYISFP